MFDKAYFDQIAFDGSVSFAQTISPGGIASAEAFGAGQLNLTLFPPGIASAEALGSPEVLDRKSVV